MASTELSSLSLDELSTILRDLREQDASIQQDIEEMKFGQIGDADENLDSEGYSSIQKFPGVLKSLEALSQANASLRRELELAKRQFDTLDRDAMTARSETMSLLQESNPRRVSRKASQIDGMQRDLDLRINENRVLETKQQILYQKRDKVDQANRALHAEIEQLEALLTRPRLLKEKIAALAAKDRELAEVEAAAATENEAASEEHKAVMETLSLYRAFMPASPGSSPNASKKES